jgi:signal transduction histidine kinase
VSSSRSTVGRAPLLGAFGLRLFLALALLSLLVAAAVGALAYHQARSALRDEAMAHMRDVARERRARLESWFEERLGDMDLLTAQVERELGGAEPDRQALQTQLDLLLGRQSAYRRCALISSRGSLLADAGVSGPEHSLPDLPELREALKTGDPVLGPVVLDPAGDPVMHLVRPLTVHGERRGALLAVMRPGRSIHPILSDTTGLGETGETYLVGADTLMLTPSRHMNHPPALTHTMPTPGVHAALTGVSGGGIYRGYLGDQVLGAYEWLPRQRWALLAEIQVDEAFAPLRRLARQIVLLGLLAVLAALALAVSLSRRLSAPLVELAAASERVATGDLSQPEFQRGQDEVGVLGERFGEMVGALRHSYGELEQSGRELARAERQAELGLLAAGLVHEMRNPLAAVKMNLSSLARSEVLNAVEREQLQIAREQGERLERMLGELLDFSRPAEPALRPLGLRELLAEAARLSAGERERREQRLELETPDPDLSFTADREMLLRALVNLLDNAAQASEPGAVIRLSAEAIEADISLSVADSGRGMKESVRERLFDPFFTTREEGVGLGMATVRKCVEAQNGEIAVESREGEGSRITLRLPANPDPEE